MPGRKTTAGKGAAKDVKKVRALDAFVARLASAWCGMGNVVGAFGGDEEAAFGAAAMVQGSRFRAWAFPASLTGYERHCVHAMAETHGLWSESVGEGSERHIVIAAPGVKAEKIAEEEEKAARKLASDAEASAGRARARARELARELARQEALLAAAKKEKQNKSADAATSGDGKDKRGESAIRQSGSDSSDSEDSDSEDSDSDSDDDLESLRKKRPTHAGFAFSDSEDDDDDSSDGESNDDDDDVDDESQHQDAALSKPTQQNNKKTQPAADTFDEAMFLEEAARRAREEEAALSKDGLADRKSMLDAINVDTWKKIGEAAEIASKSVEEPPKAPAISVTLSSVPPTTAAAAPDTKATEDEVKVSEEEKRRLAIIAAVAAARVSSKAAAQAEGKSKKMRKATVDDLLGVGRGATMDTGSVEGGPRVEAFRKQVEHGPKKFIKP